MEKAIEWMQKMCLDLLKTASKANKFELQFLGLDLLQKKSVQNEIS